MPKEQKKLKNSKSESKNIMKQPLSSLNAEVFSPIISKPPPEKKFSSKKSTYTHTQNWPLKVPHSYKNISNLLSEEPPNSNTENHGPRSSRPLPPSPPEPLNSLTEVPLIESYPYVTISSSKSKNHLILKDSLKTKESNHTKNKEIS